MTNEQEFKVWLETTKGHSPATASSRISSVRRVEKHVEALDDHLTQEGGAFLDQFSFDAKDARDDRSNPSPVPIDGDLRTGLASIRQALSLYQEFLAEGAALPDKTAHQSLLDRLTRAEIQRAMDECTSMGERAFLARAGFAQPKVRFAESGGDETYPAKATVAAALRHLPDPVVLSAKTFFNGFGEAQSFSKLEELGFEVLRQQDGGDAGVFTRAAIEGAMDAYDLKDAPEMRDNFANYDEPRKYWVRSTRSRETPIYPTKPIVGYILGKTSKTLNGGWHSPTDAAGRLHKSGYIIVDQDNKPLPLPVEYARLTRGADRARLVALNYCIEPAREAGHAEVTIRVSDLHDMSGLERNWANVCQALEGEKFLAMARVSAPRAEGPLRSTTTQYTFQLSGTERTVQKMQDAAEDTRDTAPMPETTNLILYGPPGTGKTYTTAFEAVRLCGVPVPEDRNVLMALYHQLLAAGRIEFVTFHQSMAYEEFVEGRQPMTGEDGEGAAGGFRLETVPGIFRRICKRAETSRGHAAAEDEIPIAGRKVFKMSIGEVGNPEDDHLFEEAIFSNHTLLGYDDIDLTDERFTKQEEIIAACKAYGDHNSDVDARSAMVQAFHAFRAKAKIGDVVVVTKGNLLFRAVGVFTGDYEFAPRDGGGYAHRRAVRWLWIDREGVRHDEIYPNRFTQKSAYELQASDLNLTALERYMNSQRSDGPVDPDPFVLIIDEINRANISKVFGELITLLEPDKRLGQPNQLRVRLPYSGDDFGVPSNLHIVGTMNTADRSIALLDTALRRRFTFREMMPRPEVLNAQAALTGIDLPRLLQVLNDRIEYLFDREHLIGHAYFAGCRTRTDVDDVMRDRVIPLLSEYFFEDFSRVAAVLGDIEPHEGPISGGFLKRETLMPPPGLADPEAMPRFRWAVRNRDEGFDYGRLLNL